MRSLLIVAVAASLFGGCVRLSFARTIPEEELILRDQIRSYYDEVSAAFAAGNSQMLSDLYDPDITHPMTKDKIRAWGADFFQKHGPAAFKVVKLDFESVGHVDAVVTLTYRVTTRDGDGSFGGTERDKLVQRTGRRWYVSGWDKVAP